LPERETGECPGGSAGIEPSSARFASAMNGHDGAASPRWLRRGELAATRLGDRRLAGEDGPGRSCGDGLRGAPIVPPDESATGELGRRGYGFDSAGPLPPTMAMSGLMLVRFLRGARPPGARETSTSQPACTVDPSLPLDEIDESVGGGLSWNPVAGGTAGPVTRPVSSDAVGDTSGLRDGMTPCRSPRSNEVAPCTSPM
jgi:hypothetical protein